MNIKIVIATLLVASLWGCKSGSQTNHDTPLVLFDFEHGFDPDKVEAKRMDVSLISEEGNNSLLLHSHPETGSAGIVLRKSEGSWDLIGYMAVKMDITNMDEKAMQIILQVGSPDDSFEGWQMQEVVDLEPGQTKTVTDHITVTPWLFSEPFPLVGMFGPPGQVKSDLSSIDQIKVSTRFATKPQSFKIDNIRAEGAVQYRDTAGFLPFVDRFGQYKHSDWPGKIHSKEDFEARRIKEEQELEAKPEPANRGKYGGWTAGPKLEATGHFRTARVDGIWWLVDPEGYLFWSNGVNCVNAYSGNTGLDGRENYFEELPHKEGPFGEFYGRSRGSSRHFYKDFGPHETYNFTGSNLRMKFGDDWEKEFKRLAHARLRSWGMNTFANASSRELYMEGRTPYVATVWVRGTRKIEASSGYQGPFHDVFDPSFRIALKRSLSYKKEEAKDPWCLGFFIENELSWGRDGSLSVAALASPAGQPAKIEFISDLKAKYGNIEKLNAVWESSYTSWEDMLQNQEKPDEELASEDLNVFYQKIATTYFSTVHEEMKAIAPNILDLGCRLAWANSDIVVRTAAQYCDVISYNKYEYSVANVGLPEGIDMPILIGEYHFGALDRGLFHVGIKSASSQENRGECFQHYVESALAHPHIVGTHWFQYGDQAVTGRGDGENYNVGLVSIGDIPFPELINAIRETSYPLFEYRSREAASIASEQ